ncbi:fimbrial assembly protein [Paraburkholderia flava]|uniref:fimbrial assembly protein n=1 Tax=Paraburkholderia flava TaxID=2547393 RepID=UPI001060A550|nr:fimbrial assembly protein [Paraburkholderia flava]
MKGARVFPDRDFAWIGGFNLLPYRRRNALRARRRFVAECGFAALVGGACVLLLVGWHTYQRSRIDGERVTVERTLTQLAVPLAEHARLSRDAHTAQSDAADAATRSAPLDHLRDLLDVLSNEPASGVVLERLRHRGQQTDLVARAADRALSAAWIERLDGVRGAQGADASDLHHAASSGSGHGKSDAVDGSFEFGAAVRWAGAMDDAKGAVHRAFVAGSGGVK